MSGQQPRRIYLSPPHLSGGEADRVLDALASNWVAPLGPEVDRFEARVAAGADRAHGAATSSGTAALHLALRLVGVRPGSDVLMPTLTFVATANAALYLGARPVFLDVAAATWTLDPDLLDSCLDERARDGRPTGAVVAVDLYGQCSDYDRLAEVCERHGVPLVVDAAESLGATYRGRPAGSAGELAVFSFNGNKIITTGGGGMLVGDDDRVARARWLAAQAREPVSHYEHRELGYNYRLSNLLAAVGLAQLDVLPDRVARRRQICARYRSALAALDGVSFMPVADYGEPSAWLTVLQLDTTVCPTPEAMVQALELDDIEARPAWKPMHLQPQLSECERVGGSVAESVFAQGLCLPSGSSLTDSEQDQVIERVTQLIA